MSVSDILHEIEALPSSERELLIEKLAQFADIPDSFRESMEAARRDELVDLEEALKELD